MLFPSWSLGLVGLGLITAIQGSPSSGTGGSEAPVTSVQSESRLVELSGGIRLLGSSPDDSGQFAACVGLVVGVATSDRVRRAMSLVELELRRENLATAYREKFGTEPGHSRMLDVLSGDVASLCVSVPKSEWESALSIVLQALRPVIVTGPKITDARDKWRNHQGLGALLNEEPIQGQLQELTWFGFPQAMASIPRAIEQTLSLQVSGLPQTAPSKPSRVAVSMAGEYSQQSAEKYVRGHALVREQLRSQRSHGWTSDVAAQPTHQFPRFARTRSFASKVPALIFSWPISHLDNTHARDLNIIANVLEHRLNHGSSPNAAGVATCRLVAGRGFGSFIIEIQTTPTIEFDTLERRVFSAIDQLRTSSIEASELQRASDVVKGLGSVQSAKSALDQAWAVSLRAFYFDGASSVRTMTTNEPSIRHLVERDLSRNNLAEMVVEAAPPRQVAVSRNIKNRSVGASRTKSRNPVAAGRIGLSPMDRRGGRIYTVQKGESLQMIAHKYHVTIAAIIHANGIQHPDQIRPGTVIVVPVSSDSAASAK